MRITYRQSDNKQYWTSRWANIPADAPMQNLDSYPLKYAEMVVDNKEGRLLEAGCGAGRILRYYHECGMEVVGIDFVAIAIDKLKSIDTTLNVRVGDITNLDFPDSYFRYVLAFGLYHNLEHGLEQSISETYRVLEPSGKVCASFRADNLQTRLTDWLAERRTNNKMIGTNTDLKYSFHKMNLTRNEFSSLFESAGFEVENIFAVTNMPFLYKFRFFRARNHKTFDEYKARIEGYRLSLFGNFLQNILMRVLPNQFCNIFVIIAKRPSE